MAAYPDESELAVRRAEMVDRQLRRRNVRDESVLDAMQAVQRHQFVDPTHLEQAYDDHPLPIGSGQTISQPYMVARMTELCDPRQTDRVLEVGAGSGYQTAVLACLCQQVYAVEYVGELARRCEQTLERLGYHNATVVHGDGSAGLPEHAPFDVILVAAAAPSVPEPLLEQLAPGGRLVVPVGGRQVQTLKLITLGEGGRRRVTDDTLCRFVNLRGEHGWD
jgi:protein-L-isoaspartate(D-aspartate) O-methyltransferase